MSSSLALEVGYNMYPIREWPFDRSYDGVYSVKDLSHLSLGVDYHITLLVVNGKPTFSFYLPYMGVINKDASYNALTPGIYAISVGRGIYEILFRYPRKKECELYCTKKNIIMTAANGEYKDDDFLSNTMSNEDIGDDAYMPPVRSSFDWTHMLLATAIRLKRAPFGPYGRRLEDMAIDKSEGSTEAACIKGNTRRMMNASNNISANRFANLTNIWDLDVAVVIRDKPNAIDPMQVMHGDGMVYYLGEPFDFVSDDLVPMDQFISKAINDTLEEGDEPVKRRRKKKGKVDDPNE